MMVILLAYHTGMYNHITPVDLYLNFEKSSWKNQVRNRLKSSTDQQEERLVRFIKAEDRMKFVDLFQLLLKKIYYIVHIFYST